MYDSSYVNIVIFPLQYLTYTYKRRLCNTYGERSLSREPKALGYDMTWLDRCNTSMTISNLRPKEEEPRMANIF